MHMYGSMYVCLYFVYVVNMYVVLWFCSFVCVVCIYVCVDITFKIFKILNDQCSY